MQLHDDDELLSAYMDGELASGVAAAVEARLAEEEPLRQRLAELRLNDETLNHYLQAASPTTAADALIPDHWRNPTPTASWHPGSWQRQGWVAAAASIAMIVGVSLGYYVANANLNDRVLALAEARLADQVSLNQIVVQALQGDHSGAALIWRNHLTGSYGKVTQVRRYNARDGRTCQEFTATRIIDGNASGAGADRDLRSIACQDDGGAWRIELRLAPDR